MSLAEAPRKLWTAEEIFALPDDGIHREIINGELRERPMTVRNRTHSKIEATIVGCLREWLKQLSEPRGKISCGEVGFRLRRAPETLVGIDVAYASAELIAATDPQSVFYDGPPVLAVEILSPSDQYGDWAEKVELYLEVGTVVWVVEPDISHGQHPPAWPDRSNFSARLRSFQASPNYPDSGFVWPTFFHDRGGSTYLPI